MARSPKPHWFPARDCWRFQHGGKQRYFKRESDAWAAIAEIEKHGGAKSDLVAEAIADFVEIRPRRAHALRAFLDFAGSKFLHEVTTRDLATLTAQLEAAGKKPWTIRQYISAAHTLLRWAYETGLLEKLPPKPKLPVARANPSPIDLDLLSRILDSFDKKIGARALAVITFRIETGCRPGEACGLKWSYLDVGASEHGIFRIPADRHKTGRKTGRDRVIYLTAAARAIVDRQRADPLPEFVFRSRLDQPYTPGGLRSVWNAAVRRVDPELKISSYRLRHLFGFLMRRQGVPVDVLQKLYGHTNINTTMIYYRAEDSAALAAMASASALSPALPGPAAPAANKSTEKPRRRKTRARSADQPATGKSAPPGPSRSTAGEIPGSDRDAPAG